MKNTATVRPSALETTLNRWHQQGHVINFDTEYNHSDKVYEFEQIAIEPGHWNYGDVVSAIIRDRYPNDAMEAIINNYLPYAADPSSAPQTIKEEFDSMQAWRAHAKEVAHSYFQNNETD